MERFTLDSALEQLAKVLGERARRNEPLAPYTSIRVGGPADLLVVCRTGDQMVDAVRLASSRGLPWRVLGSGCNILVADAGVRGLVVINRADRMTFEEDGVVWAESGTLMRVLARDTTGRGLAGLEWAAGLPGTVGGAVVGNAGAFDGDVASVLTKATLLAPEGEVVERSAKWFEFRYRGSRIKGGEEGKRYVVLDATFGLQPEETEVLVARVDEILRWRRERHPAGATMGSTFKNPPGDHAGRLIELAGLKGQRIGGVKVSEQHANFLINTGKATADDVLALIRRVQAEVEDRFGVGLTMEVELVGEWE
ncbi:MAG: UDP-N-acetylmuramate dehydrogenase [Anaerolineae bacterium]|jgi:UDP-N-acetylmuramate dehydrogenase